MTGWIKHFSDGTSELGSDTLVRGRKASWRHGRQQGLVAVDLHWKGKLYTLSAGEGEYWQSDTMVSVYVKRAVLAPRFLARRVSRKIDSFDVGKNIYCLRNDNVLRVKLTDEDNPVAKGYFPITGDHIGKWLILEVDGDTGNAKITLQPARK